MTLNEQGEIVPKIGDFGIVVPGFQAQNGLRPWFFRCVVSSIFKRVTMETRRHRP
jgi:hypothetical protein